MIHEKSVICVACLYSRSRSNEIACSMYEGVLTNMHTPSQVTNLPAPTPAPLHPRPSPPLHPL